MFGSRELPKTLQEAISYFADELICIATVAQMVWPEGKPICPSCGKLDHNWLANQKRWKCRACKRQFSVKVGTIFEDSPLGLDKWLLAMWMIANCRNGVSSYEIARAIGITQKAAWHMMHRVREAMKDKTDVKLGGIVEADESFYGGRISNMHQSKRAELGGKTRGVKGKAIVVGMVERGGRVRAEVVVERTKPVLHDVVARNVDPEATLVTDEWGGYVGSQLIHEVINHSIEYVNGHIHTNGIENFWSLLKRGIGGTYISVSPAHLQRYVAEQVFRYNQRKREGVKRTDTERFLSLLSDVSGRRLTYADLISKGERATL